jgi:hypothetical protein
MLKTRDRFSDKADTVRPYFERALKDEQVRENVKGAFAAARSVYDELLGQRGVTTVATRMATDKEIQDNLRTAIDELRHAADRIQGKEEHGARNTVLLLAGITLGILFNPVTGPTTRRWLKDAILGPSDDFTYTGTQSGNGGAGATPT